MKRLLKQENGKSLLILFFCAALILLVRPFLNSKIEFQSLALYGYWFIVWLVIIILMFLFRKLPIRSEPSDTDNQDRH